MSETIETGTKLSYDDYCALPDDGKRYELIEGVLYEMAAPKIPHQRALGNIYLALRTYFGTPNEVFLAPTDVILSRHNVVQPDVLVVGDPGIVTHRAVEGSPLLAVEILSPSNRSYDRIKKRWAYAKHDVQHVWLVDPEDQSVECYQLKERFYFLAASCVRGEKLEHPAFPGLTLETTWF